ncbi:hypothetical protein HDV02_000487, partial [Globomyces sp. JEL0801]
DAMANAESIELENTMGSGDGTVSAELDPRIILTSFTPVDTISFGTYKIPYGYEEISGDGWKVILQKDSKRDSIQNDFTLNSEPLSNLASCGISYLSVSPELSKTFDFKWSMFEPIKRSIQTMTIL